MAVVVVEVVVVVVVIIVVVVVFLSNGRVGRSGGRRETVLCIARRINGDLSDGDACVLLKECLTNESILASN